MADIRKKFNRDLANFTDRQLAAVHELEIEQKKFVLYGGAVGGGKSYFLRWYAIRFLMSAFKKYKIKHLTLMLACEDYPTLKDRQLQKIGREFPVWMGKSHSDHKEYGRCFILSPNYGSGVICFRNLDDPSKYQSAEFAAILVDELTKNAYDVFCDLRHRMRFPGIPENECKFIGATNPGGIGHGWCKQLWMDKQFPEEWLQPIDFSGQFAYVPAKADDNPHLDAGYWAGLQTLPPHLRSAFRDGDWSVFVGQAFTDFYPNGCHVIDPIPVPDYAPLYMTYDWGFGAPFSIGWWWVDADGRVYRFAEWYGYNGTPNTGLRLADREVASKIKQKEEALGIWDRNITRLAGPDCFSKKPDPRGGGQGPSTHDEFLAFDTKLQLRPGDPDRKLKIKQFHQRLMLHEDQAPMMLIYRTCDQFTRTIPNLVVDKHNVEDVDTDGEDHIYDEACHICMARPLQHDQDAEKADLKRKELEAKRESLEPSARRVWEELDQMRQQLEEAHEDWEAA